MEKRKQKKKKPRKYSRYDAEKVAKAAQMHEEGKSYGEIAKYLGCSLPTAKTYLERRESNGQPKKKPCQGTCRGKGLDLDFLEWWHKGIQNNWFNDALKLNETVKGR